MNPVLSTTSDPRYRRLDLNPNVEASVEKLFDDAAVNFLEGVTKFIPFDPGYAVKDGECFEINDYKVDDELLQACKQPLTSDRITPPDVLSLQIKAIVGYQINGTSNSLFFQNFNGSKVVTPGKRFALFSVADTSTFEELKRPVVLLDSNINAIWIDGRLLFKSFHMAKQMLDLSNYFEAATDKQLDDFAGHKLIECDDVGKFKADNNYWTRKKVAMILASGYIDKVTPKEMRDIASAVQFNLTMKKGKIVIPADTNEMRDLLHFLDEDFSVGYFSKRLLLSNSKRER